MKQKLVILFAGIVMLSMILFTGCSYQQKISYPLNEKSEIVRAEKTTPLKVKVAAFSDNRDPVEKDKNERKQAGDPDAGDFTYDNEFKGSVADEVTLMVIDHLNYSKAFKPPVTLADASSEYVSDSVLEKLNAEGVDGLLVGELQSFYGYYDQNIGRQLLYELPLAVASGLLLTWTTSDGMFETTYYWYGPGLVLGAYLETLHKRRIEQRTKLSLQLISTTTHAVVWQDTFEVYQADKRSMPGFGARKYQVALNSLRDAVNDIVTSLSENSDLIVQSVSTDTLAEKVEYKKHRSRQKKDAGYDEEIVWASHRGDRSTRFGVRAGMNLSSFSGEDAGDSGMKAGFCGGVFINIPIGDKFALQPELLYTMKGTEYEESSIYGDFSVSTTLHYIDVPILLQFSPHKKISLSAGPYLGLFLSGSDKMKMDMDFMGEIISDEESYDIESDEVSNPEFGAVFGASFVTGKFDLGVRYSMALTSWTSYEDSDLKNNVIQFTAGIQF